MIDYYTPAMMKQHLGEDVYEPDAEYVLETHKGAFARVLNPEWVEVGLVPDRASGEEGTMIVFKRVTLEEGFAAAGTVKITERGEK